jgi:hypothetical protein
VRCHAGGASDAPPGLVVSGTRRYATRGARAHPGRPDFRPDRPPPRAAALRRRATAGIGATGPKTVDEGQRQFYAMRLEAFVRSMTEAEKGGQSYDWIAGRSRAASSPIEKLERYSSRARPTGCGRASRAVHKRYYRSSTLAVQAA